MLVSKAVQADPTLAPCIDENDYYVHDIQWLKQHIVQLQSDHLQEVLEGIVHDTSDYNTNSKKSEATKKIRWRKKLWAKIGKAIFLQGITGSDGTALTSDGAAQALQAHWGDVFARKDGDTIAFENLRPFIQEVPNGIVWDISLDEVTFAMGRCMNSAPGPDGIKHQAWSLVGDVAAAAIHDVCQAVLQGMPPPPWFNLSNMAFLAKGKEDDDHHFTARTPSCTRPFSLADSVTGACRRSR